MQLPLTRLRPDQSAIVRHQARVKVIAAGRRFGKTFMCGTVVIAAAAHGNRVAWVVPTYKNSRPVWRHVQGMLGSIAASGKDAPIVINRADRSVEFSGGGWLGIYSADSDVSIRGEAFHLVVVDEAARVSETTWTDVIMPTLADYGGQAILISTPMGRNWFWREWERGQAQMDDEQASFTAPSIDNPMPTIRRAAELARERVPERVYRQEWLAEFLEDSGGVFRKVRDAATATPQERAIPGHHYVVGCDWGKLNDFTVFVVIDTTTREVVALDRSNKVDYQLQVGRLLALCQRFTPQGIYPEQNSMGEPLVEQLQRQNLPIYPFTTTNASKAQVIDALALAFERSELRILPDETLLNELLAYQAERLPSGLLRYGAPEGLHDDTVISLALAWWGASQPTVQFF